MRLPKEAKLSGMVPNVAEWCQLVTISAELNLYPQIFTIGFMWSHLGNEVEVGYIKDCSHILRKY